MGSEHDDDYRQAIILQAEYLGMDPKEDQDLLWLAEDSLNAPLPEGWEMVMGEGEHDGVPFYFNEKLEESIWEHPLDSYYREQYRKLKEEIARREREGRGGARSADSRDDEDDGRRGSSGGRRRSNEDYEDDGDDDRRGRGGARRYEDDEYDDRRGRRGEDGDPDRDRGIDGRRREGLRKGNSDAERQRANDWTDEEEDRGRHDEGGPDSPSAPHSTATQPQAQTLQSTTRPPVKDTPIVEHMEIEEIQSFDFDDEDSQPAPTAAGARAHGAVATDETGKHAAPSTPVRDRDEWDDRGRADSFDELPALARRRSGEDTLRGGSEQTSSKAVPTSRPTGTQKESTRFFGLEEEEFDDDYDDGGLRRQASVRVVDEVRRAPHADKTQDHQPSNTRKDDASFDDDDFDDDRDYRARDVGRRGQRQDDDVQPLQGVTPRHRQAGQSHVERTPVGLGNDKRGAGVDAGVVAGLEERLAEATSWLRGMEDELSDARKETKAALDKAHKATEVERQAEELRVDLEAALAEKKRAIERLTQEKEDAVKAAGDAWAKERQELIKMRRTVEERADDLEDQVTELKRTVQALKKDQEEAVQRASAAAASAVDGMIKKSEADEMAARAKAQATAEAREAADEDWHTRLEEARRRAREREEALERQLEAQNERMDELERQLTDQADNDAGALAALEADLKQVEEELDGEKRGRRDDAARMEETMRGLREEVVTAKAAAEEAKANIARLMQEAAAATARAESVAREAQTAKHAHSSLEAEVEKLRVDKASSEAATAAITRELTDSQAAVARLKTEIAELQRNLSAQRQDMARAHADNASKADRERILETELSRLKANQEAAVSSLERRLAELQHANTTLQRELAVQQGDSTQQIRELESARDILEYEKKRAEERASAAESWRQKESARAKQAEDALESVREELRAVRSQLPSMEEAKAAAAGPLKARVVDLERELGEARRAVEEKDRVFSAMSARHESHIENIKAEISSKLPSIAAAAIRRVEEEYRRRMEEECRAVREASEKEAEGGHLRAVALKAQLVEVQSKLQSQLSAERVASEALQRSVARLEEENRAMRMELGGKGLSTGHAHSTPSRQPPPSQHPWTPSPHWEQAVHASTMALLQGHIQVLQQQISSSLVRSPSSRNPKEMSNASSIHVHNADESFSSTDSDIGRHTNTTLNLDMSINTAAVLDQDDHLGLPPSPDRHSTASLPITRPIADHISSPPREVERWATEVVPREDRSRMMVASTSTPRPYEGISMRLGGPSLAYGFYEGYWRQKYARDAWTLAHTARTTSFVSSRYTVSFPPPSSKRGNLTVR